MIEGDKPEAYLTDGIWPNTGTYIQIEIPYVWFEHYPDDGPEEPGTDEIDQLLTFDLVDLIEQRLRDGIEDVCIPTPAIAKRTIIALRAYAEMLEREFVVGAHRWDDDGDEVKPA